MREHESSEIEAAIQREVAEAQGYNRKTVPDVAGRDILPKAERVTYLKDRIDQIIEGGGDVERLLQIIEWWDEEYNPANPSRGED